MLMKVYSKGQIVIPANIRHALNIEAGDRLDVRIDRNGGAVQLKKPEKRLSDSLAGSMTRYAKKKPFPGRQKMEEALVEGLNNG